MRQVGEDWKFDLKNLFGVFQSFLKQVHLKNGKTAEDSLSFCSNNQKTYLLKVLKQKLTFVLYDVLWQKVIEFLIHQLKCPKLTILQKE